MKLANWAAVAFFVAGLVVAVFVGARAVGGMIFALGVVCLGVGSLARDRAVGVAMIVAGLAAAIGVLGHMITGVGF